MNGAISASENTFLRDVFFFCLVTWNRAPFGIVYSRSGDPTADCCEYLKDVYFSLNDPCDE